LEPDLNLEQLKNEIKGKTVSAADVRLRQIENAISVRFDFKPKFGGVIPMVPFLSKNINIEITSK